MKPAEGMAPCNAVGTRSDESSHQHQPTRVARSLHAVEETLIYAVYKRRPLWDPSVHFYRNNTVVKLLWEEVAHETGLTDIQAKARWKSLRDYYRLELKKIKKAGGEGLKKPLWIYFQSMSFLEGLMTGKKSSNSKSSEESDESLSAGDESMEAAESLLAISANNKKGDLIVENSDVAIDRIKAEGSIGEQEPLDERSLPVDSTSPFSKEMTGSMDTRNPLKMRVNYDILHRKLMYHLENRRLDLLERSFKLDDDSDLLFFRSILPLIKTLPEAKRMRLRLKFHELVCEEIEEQNKA